MKKRLSADYIAKVAILSALAVVLHAFIRFPLFPAPYNVLELDFSALPSLLGGFSLGPWAVVLIEIIKIGSKIAIEGPTLSGVGDLSNFIISLSFVLPATIIYKYNHTRKGAYIGLGISALSQIVVGALSNYFIIIPLYATIGGAPFAMSIRLEFAFIYGSLFNLIKGASNALLAVIFYKRLSPYLKKEYIKKKTNSLQRVVPQNYQPNADLQTAEDIEEENEDTHTQKQSNSIEIEIDEE